MWRLIASYFSYVYPKGEDGKFRHLELADRFRPTKI